MWKLVYKSTSMNRVVWHHKNEDKSILLEFEGYGKEHRVEYWNKKRSEKIDILNTFENEASAIKRVEEIKEEYK